MYRITVLDNRPNGGALTVLVRRSSAIRGVSPSCIGVGASRQTTGALASAMRSALSEVRCRRKVGQFKS